MTWIKLGNHPKLADGPTLIIILEHGSKIDLKYQQNYARSEKSQKFNQFISFADLSFLLTIALQDKQDQSREIRQWVNKKANQTDYLLDNQKRKKCEQTKKKNHRSGNRFDSLKTFEGFIFPSDPKNKNKKLNVWKYNAAQIHL